MAHISIGPVVVKVSPIRPPKGLVLVICCHDGRTFDLSTRNSAPRE